MFALPCLFSKKIVTKDRSVLRNQLYWIDLDSSSTHDYLTSSLGVSIWNTVTFKSNRDTIIIYPIRRERSVCRKMESTIEEQNLFLYSFMASSANKSLISDLKWDRRPSGSSITSFSVSWKEQEVLLRCLHD